MARAENLAKNYGDPLRPTQETKTILAGPGYHIAEDLTQPPPQSLKYWDYVKKSMDQRINTMMRSGIDDLSSAEKSDLGGLINAKQSLVSHLDSVTDGKYAEARAIASTKPELHEAFDFGQSIFNSKLLPEEVTAHINDLSMPAKAMAQAVQDVNWNELYQMCETKAQRLELSLIQTITAPKSLPYSDQVPPRQSPIEWRQKIHSSRQPRTYRRTQEPPSDSNWQGIPRPSIRQTSTPPCLESSVRLLPRR